MDTTFIRKAFYLPPPAKDANSETWEEWIKAEGLTRTQKAGFCENPHLNQIGIVKLGGVHRQSVALWSGSTESGSLVREVAVQASQETDLENVCRMADYTHKRGNVRRGRNKNKRAKRKARRKAQFVG